MYPKQACDLVRKKTKIDDLLGIQNEKSGLDEELQMSLFGFSWH